MYAAEAPPEHELGRVETLYDATLELSDHAEMHLEWFEIRVGDKGAPPSQRRMLELPAAARGEDEG